MIKVIYSKAPSCIGESRGDRTLSENKIKAINEGKARIEACIRGAFAAKGPGFACIGIVVLRSKASISYAVQEKWFQEILHALIAEGFQRSSKGECVCVLTKG